MITIFHGDNISASRNDFLQFLDSFKDAEVYHLEAKLADLNQLGNFISGGSLFGGKKVLAIDNFLSLPKAVADKLVPQLLKSDLDIVFWQDKTLTAAQLKLFPQAKVIGFKADNLVFTCLNSLRPKNLSGFIPLYRKVVTDGLFDLFLYLLKGNRRRSLQSYCKYDKKLVVKVYLQLIELEFQYKSGQLALPKELALERVVLPLLK